MSLSFFIPLSNLVYRLLHHISNLVYRLLHHLSMLVYHLVYYTYLIVPLIRSLLYHPYHYNMLPFLNPNYNYYFLDKVYNHFLQFLHLIYLLLADLYIFQYLNYYCYFPFSLSFVQFILGLLTVYYFLRLPFFFFSIFFTNTNYQSIFNKFRITTYKTLSCYYLHC